MWDADAACRRALAQRAQRRRDSGLLRGLIVSVVKEPGGPQGIDRYNCFITIPWLAVVHMLARRAPSAVPSRPPMQQLNANMLILIII